MKIAGRGKIDQFVKKHAKAKRPLERWRTLVEAADWKTPQDVKDTIGSVDFLTGQRGIFNIGGNNFRLVVEFRFQRGACLIKWIGTHAEYDKRSWKEK